MNRIYKPLLLALAMASIWACSETERPDPVPSVDYRPVLISEGERVALPLYREVLAQSVELHAQAQAFCEAPETASLEALRAQWDATRSPWKQADVFVFGPYMEEPWRVGPKLDSWPMRPVPVERLLAGDGAVDVAAVEGMGTFMKGFPVLEYLLFPLDRDDAALLAALSEGEAGIRRCTYLVSVAAELERQSARMVEAWSADGGNYAKAFADSGEEGGAFMSSRGAFAELVNRMAFTAENIREHKIGKPRGDSRGGNLDLSLLESRYSGRSLADIHDNLIGIEKVYVGSLDTEDPEAQGIRDVLLGLRPELDPAMFEHLEAARAAVDAIPVPLGEAFETHPEAVEALYQKVLELQRFIVVELAQALSVTVTFNDTDGD